MDVVEAKEIVRAEIDRLTPTLLEVSHSIHANPELNFEEHHAHDTLTGVLEDEGLAVERGAYDMATAFESRVGPTTARRSPCCASTTRFRHRPRLRAQHHRRRRSRCRAGRRQGRRGARRSCCDPRHTCRRGGGGKEFMIRRGAFDDIDLAMMVHPADRDLRTMHTIAVQQLDVQYTGRAAHAAASPHTGLNASTLPCSATTPSLASSAHSTGGADPRDLRRRRRQAQHRPVEGRHRVVRPKRQHGFPRSPQDSGLTVSTVEPSAPAARCTMSGSTLPSTT